MSSKIEILNLALIKVGTERINSLDDDSKRAKILLDVYNIVRRSVLDSHPWNFAIERAETTPELEKPAFQFAFKHRVPSDALRVFEEANENPYIREGNFLLTNCEKLQIKYIKDETNESLFSESFSEALALKLAYTICYTITQNENLKIQLFQEFQKFLAEARTYSSQESQDYDEVLITSFTDVRL